jgi:TonB family protein
MTTEQPSPGRVSLRRAKPSGGLVLRARRLGLSGRGPIWRVVRPFAIAAAAVLHAGLLWFVITHMSAPVGEEKGKIEGITVDIVDADALERQYPTAFGKRPATAAQATSQQAPDQNRGQEQPKQQAPQQPQPQQQTEQQQPQQQPSQQAPATPAAPSEPANPAPQTKAPVDEKADLIASVPPPSLDAPLNLTPDFKALARADASRASSASGATGRPLNLEALSHQGEIDEFTRAVAHALEVTKPVSNGVKGDLVVSFVVTPGGEISRLKLSSSSGNAALDNLVLDAVRHTRVRIPPAAAGIEDRTFEITYTYK